MRKAIKNSTTINRTFDVAELRNNGEARLWSRETKQEQTTPMGEAFGPVLFIDRTFFKYLFQRKGEQVINDLITGEYNRKGQPLRVVDNLKQSAPIETTPAEANNIAPFNTGVIIYGLHLKTGRLVQIKGQASVLGDFNEFRANNPETEPDFTATAQPNPEYPTKGAKANWGFSLAKYNFEEHEAPFYAAVAEMKAYFEAKGLDTTRIDAVLSQANENQADELPDWK